MAFDPSLGTTRDYIRFRLQDTNDSDPMIAEATYTAMITAFGAREAARQCAMTLAAKFSTLNYGDGDVREDLTKTADFYKGLAAEFTSDPMLDDPTAGVKAAAVGALSAPDMTDFRPD
ncbi:MAG: hypothetical protein E6R03_00205 [Hyphomicrobiaceae bacterium]|nr:MAG: hypothetical protein E6R03_00205 [Hyphomicrobiaceae bacterium]